jgi:hypothetical protein
MIMKATHMFLCLIVAILIGNCALAQAGVGSTKWSVTLKVLDEEAKPVTNADAWVVYTVPPRPGQIVHSYDQLGSGKIEGLTDTNGLFHASHTSDPQSMAWGLGINVQKHGYYPTYLKYELYLPDSADEKTVTSNNNPQLTLVLKKIGQPIPMYAKQEETKLQQEDKPMGFDLMAGDWVTPYGKGSHTDMFFTVHRKIISERDYNCTLHVTFPNKGDGIVAAPSEPDTGSEFKTSRTAAENGYQLELVLHYGNTERPESVFGYFIRVRTVMDQDGTIKSALYGKISGNFRFYAGTTVPRAGMGFTYYLNPTSNDRNVEFDPRQNLFKNLRFDEAVKAP